jgi:hypothetical protein
LAVAWRAWAALVAPAEGGPDKLPHRQQIVKWLKTNDPGGSHERHKRIATMLNQGGRTGRPTGR